MGHPATPQGKAAPVTTVGERPRRRHNEVVHSPSSKISQERPFYPRHAEAYDALIVDPVEPWVDAVHLQLCRVGASPGVVLDAGCGTGRHAAGLIQHGHDVELLDASEELLSIARRRCPTAPTHLSDICDLALSRSFDAVICRGVLNDLVTDAERDDALSSFAAAVRPDGSLVLDVREREQSAKKCNGAERRNDVDLGSGDRLIFTSRPLWRDGLIEVEEQYDLVSADGRRTTSTYAFRMRPWTVEELEQRLERAGFDRIEIAPGHGRRAQDRLFVVARRAVTGTRH
jgi:SAM-dependent methyltransferase